MDTEGIEPTTLGLQSPVAPLVHARPERSPEIYTPGRRGADRYWPTGSPPEILDASGIRARGLSLLSIRLSEPSRLVLGGVPWLVVWLVRGAD